MIDVVMFRSGSYRLALEAREVGGSRRPDATSSASAHPAIESLFGLPELGPREQPMLITLKARACEYLADGPLELCSLADQAIHGTPRLLIGVCKLRGLRALAFDERGLLLIFSATG